MVKYYLNKMIISYVKSFYLKRYFTRYFVRKLSLDDTKKSFRGQRLNC